MPDPESTGDSGVTTGNGSGSPTAVADPAPSSAATIAQPGSSDATSQKGPVPYDRFEEVNSKYNTLKWAEAHDPERVTQQTQFFKWLDSDPVGAFQYMQSYLQRSGVLKEPASNGNGHAPVDDGRPQPDVVVPETGQRFYSAEAAEKLAKWEAKQAIDPIEKRLQTFEGERAYSQAAQEASRLIKEAEGWPYYKEHEADILKAMNADKRLSIEGAYNRVVVPKIGQIERQAVLAEIQRKAQASTTNPGSSHPTASTATSKLSFAELFRQEMGRRGSV